MATVSGGEVVVVGATAVVVASCGGAVPSAGPVVAGPGAGISGSDPAQAEATRRRATAAARSEKDTARGDATSVPQGPVGALALVFGRVEHAVVSDVVEHPLKFVLVEGDGAGTTDAGEPARQHEVRIIGLGELGAGVGLA